MNLLKKIRTPWPLEDLVALLKQTRKQKPPAKTENWEADLSGNHPKRKWKEGCYPSSIPVILAKLESRMTILENGCIKINESKRRPYIGVCGCNVLCSRVLFVLIKGSLKSGELACHTCDNEWCVNVDHLFRGSDMDNKHDCMKKGRHWIGRGEHHPCARLKNKDVVNIRKLRQIGLTYSEIAEQYDVHKSTIHLIIKGKHWKGVA